MKADLIIPKDILPANGVQRKAFENGARARIDGKSKSCNPYNILRSGGFWTSWARGWAFADMGDIQIKEKS